ncbi:hypothetical protein JCM16776_1055 [Leptotrichia shahii]|uniref:DUF5362 domain-containing protein n=1 Tax=Leptotrichia shahii TaxID=157691 RepID=A0A510JR28_9FUSO|nr:DUF5362 family protein [Leptotrichia shahii]BBM40835.1 hypothetical protein JCM16776_1055 [Leptotrichia shahii]
MDFENNKNEQCHSSHDIEELDRIRNQVINNFSSNSSDFYSSSNNNENGSVTLALDDLTVKNIKFMATVIKVLSILGIIVGVFQIIILFLGIFTIIISIKFFKSANALEDTLITKNGEQLKTYFNEQSKALKLYIIFIIVSIIIGILFFSFLMLCVIGALANDSF